MEMLLKSASRLRGKGGALI